MLVTCLSKLIHEIWFGCDEQNARIVLHLPYREIMLIIVEC